MSTLDLTQSGFARSAAPRLASSAARRSRAPAILTAGLFVLVVYAVFAHGAIQSPAEARVQVAAALLAAVAAGTWLWMGTLRLAAPRAALAGLGLLAAFAVWSGVTLIWSVAPDQTWIEFNRAIAYVLVLCLAIGLGASSTTSIMTVATCFFAVALAVTAYALGQKVLPGIRIDGLINLDQTGRLARLQEPLGYWNALALLMAMGAPVALGLAGRRDGGRRLRLTALVSLELMFVAIGFTYSRGGVFALAVTLVAFLAVSGAPLRLLMWGAAAGLASLPALLVGLLSHSLSTDGVPLANRENAGLVLLAVLLVTSGALVAGGRRLLGAEERVTLPVGANRRIWRALTGAGVAAAVVLLLAMTFSSRGLTGTVSHAWTSFTQTRGVSVSNPSRLLSADSGNRWVWWKEAAGAFSDRPLTGWGAGSFPVVHLLYRRDSLSVKQPHSVPLQLLAETGLIGTLLVLGGYALLLRTGLGAVRRRAGSHDRALAAALLAGALAYALHACYDWDWDIPGVTLPALLFLGVLAGSLRAGHGRDVAAAPLLDVRTGPSAGTRIAALGAVTIALCAFALSATLPSLAAGRAADALVAASAQSSSSLQSAASSAALAASLDPLSDAGLTAEATIALHRNDLALARMYLIQAVGRDPSDVQAWSTLAYVNALRGDLIGSVAAAQRVLALDPVGGSAGQLARGVTQGANLLQAPPKDSATSGATP